MERFIDRKRKQEIRGQADKVPSSYSAKHKNRDRWELIGTDW